MTEQDILTKCLYDIKMLLIGRTITPYNWIDVEAEIRQLVRDAMRDARREALRGN